MSLPIRTLERVAAARIEAHLLRLAPADRSLRFAAGVVTDEPIRRDVAGIRFGFDAVLGIVDAQGELAALAHGCVYAVGGRTQVEAAFSVDRALRGQGIGTSPMTAVREVAASMGAESVVAMCVACNLPMRRIFAGAGMAMTREHDEVHARCALQLTRAAANVEAMAA